MPEVVRSKVKGMGSYGSCGYSLLLWAMNEAKLLKTFFTCKPPLDISSRFADVSFSFFYLPGRRLTSLSVFCPLLPSADPSLYSFSLTVVGVSYHSNTLFL